MLQCWERDPEMRPTFSSIVELLSSSLETIANYMETGPSTIGDNHISGATILENNNCL